MNEQLNRAAHEALGKCWHIVKRDPIPTCLTCGQQYAGLAYYEHPDYCSEDSPRSLVAELERFTIEKVGRQAYIEELARIVEPQWTIVASVTATAEQRVRACLNALGKED